MLLAIGLCSISIFIVLFGLGLFTGSSAQAQGKDSKTAPSKEEARTGVISAASNKNDVSPPLRNQPPWPVVAKQFEREANVNPKIPHKHVDSPDPVVQNAHASILAQLVPSIPSPIRNFDGIPFPGVGCNCAPPDTDGEVGATQYVQMVNEAVQVFDKATGNSLMGPVSINSLWAGFGGICETGGGGDPVVLYDQLANRWVITQFAGSPPTHECIAVSQTSDATGAYFRYDFTLGTNFFDYPHLGVWPDAYYCAFNVFNAGGTAFLGGQAFAFDRAKMLLGQPATFVTPGILPGGSTDEVFLPADLDGSILPTSGAPATFVYWPGGASGNTYRVLHFHADFVTPAMTTFTLFATVPSAGFTELCPGTRACVPEMGGAAGILDGIGDRLMFRLAYRKFADNHEAVVGNFSVSSGGVAGIRWFELRNVTAGPVTLFQESTYQPDTTWRWMGSVAMDGNGSLALGFSASSPTINPEMRYAGRFASDPIGVLAQGEATVPISPTGNQTSGLNRWGDYSDLTIDPVDDATFWFTTEYIPSNGTFNWRTRIASFKLPTTPTNNVIAGGSYIVSAGANNVLDPGEVVTVALGLKNSGGPGNPCTTALTGTLQAGGGVTNPPAAQNYGVQCASNPVVFRNYTFTVDPALACGGTVTATLNALDAGTPYGPFVFTFPTGSTQTGAVENFDGVTAPALPAGWSTTFSGTGTAATTVTTFPDTAPNSVFTSEASNVGLSEVTSAPVAVTGGAQLSFRNEFNTESGFDGKVMEIAIPGVAGGAFQDILTAGGSFASGGYNSTLSTGFSNPLPGRMAWTGLSGGTAAAPTYITTVVNLPAAAAGQSVQFRWRQGSDNSVVPGTNPGSRVDTITLVAAVCGGSAPTVNTAVSRKTHTGVGDFDVPLPLVGVGGAVGIEPRSGPNHTMVVTFANPVTLGGAAVTTGAGSASALVAGNVVTVNLTGITDAQRIGVTLSNVSNGANLGSVLIPMGVLNGDTSANGVVSGTDVGQTKAAAATGTVNASTFRTDVNVNGTVNASDVGLVKSKSGALLPP